MAVETKTVVRRRQIKSIGKAAVLGVVLGLLCNLLPPEYRVACEVIVKLCSGGI